jgi:hypothetical protein
LIRCSQSADLKKRKKQTLLVYEEWTLIYECDITY